MSQSGESTPKATEIPENPDNDLHAAMVGAHDIGSNSEMVWQEIRISMASSGH